MCVIVVRGHLGQALSPAEKSWYCSSMEEHNVSCCRSSGLGDKLGTNFSTSLQEVRVLQDVEGDAYEWVIFLGSPDDEMRECA